MKKYAVPQGSHLRLGRVSLPQQIYLITIVTKCRAKSFASSEAAVVAARCFYDDLIAGCAETLAFVVMPDHVHWLMQLTDLASLSNTVRSYKAKVSILLGRPIWQRGFYDHALRSDDNVVGIARYVVANPLRAGLCPKLGDYPYWNAKWL